MRNLLGILIAFAIVLTAACGTSPNPAKLNSLGPDAPQRVVIDDLGKSVVIPENVNRTVSLAPNLTEIVFAVGAGDKLVGDTTYCNYPPEAQRIPKVGDTLKPNIETIVALKPEVVFVSTASQLETFIATLTEQKIAVFVTNPDSLDGIYSSIEKIGAVFKSETSPRLIAELKERIGAVERKTTGADRPKVFLQLDKSLFTIGRGSYLTDLIRRAGGESATSDVEKAYTQLSKETALAIDPEIIVLSESSDNDAPADVFRNSRAVRNGRVYRINADLISRPGPRVADALEQLAAALHPEIFKK